MKKLKIFVYFLKLIRWPNLLMVMATMFAMRYFIIAPLLKVNGLEVKTSLFDFVLLVIATTLITAAGYIINDYFDRKTDLINKPYKVIVGRFIRRRAAMAMHVIFSSLGVLIGTYLAYVNHMKMLSLIFILATGILWFYSTSYKRQVVLGNLIVAIMTAMVPVLVVLLEFPLLNKSYGSFLVMHNTSFKYLLFWIGSFAYFAFITSLIREIVKDIEDIEGDQAYGRVSIPMYIGVGSTKIVLIVLTLITMVSVAFLAYRFLFDYYTIAYLTLFVIVPSAFLINNVIKAKVKADYSKASKLIKLIMAFGVLYSAIVPYIISQNF